MISEEKHICYTFLFQLILDCGEHGQQEGLFCRCHRGWQTVSETSAVDDSLRMKWCSKSVPVTNYDTFFIVKYLLIFVSFQIAQ